METNKVKRVFGSELEAQNLDVQQRRRRLDLHATSAVDSGPGRHDLSALNPDKRAAQEAEEKAARADAPHTVSYRLADGTVVDIVGLSDAMHLEIARAFARVSPERRAALEKSARAIAAAVYAEVAANPEAVTGEVSTRVSSALADAQAAYLLGEGADAHREGLKDSCLVGLWGIETELRDFVDEVRGRQAIENETRADVAELGEMLAEWPDDGSTQSFTYREVAEGPDGELVVTEKTVELTKEEAVALHQSLSLQLQSVAGITQMDAFLLQKMATEYNHAVTTLTNIMKQQDETMRGTIQNVKA